MTVVYHMQCTEQFQVSILDIFIMHIFCCLFKDNWMQMNINWCVCVSVCDTKRKRDKPQYVLLLYYHFSIDPPKQPILPIYRVMTFIFRMFNVYLSCRHICTWMQYWMKMISTYFVWFWNISSWMLLLSLLLTFEW